MSEFANEKIERIINEGYDFRMGDYISQGLNTVQKNLGGFILYALAMFVILAVVNFIPIIGALLNQFILGPALTVGAYLVANKIRKGESTEFSDFFKGFDYVRPLALTALGIFVVTILAMLPFVFLGGGMELFSWYMDMMQDPMGMQGTVPDFGFSILSFLLLLPAVYLGVAYSWAYKFVVFYDMSFWDAMEASRKVITKKWFMIFIFMIIIGIIAGLGILLLCVGILFTFPAYLCMNFSAFADVTRLDEEGDAMEEIERHLVD
jgi:hypothetical protein